MKNGEPQADYKVDFDNNVYLQAYQVTSFFMIVLHINITVLFHITFTFSFHISTYFAHNDMTSHFQAMLDVLGVGRTNTGLNVQPSCYKHHCCLFAYNDSPDSCNNMHLHFTPNASTGVISARVTFSKALAKPLKMVLFASHAKSLMIDKNLNTSIHNTV